MRTITREALIERLTELEPRERVEPAVDGAIEALGWQDKPVFTAAEVIGLGTIMAEMARQTLAASAEESDRRAAGQMRPLIEGLRDDVLPVLGAQAPEEGR